MSKSKRLSSSGEESDAETLDATIDEDSNGYAINSATSSSTKKAAAYTQAKKKSGKLILDEAVDDDNDGHINDISGQSSRTVTFPSSKSGPVRSNSNVAAPGTSEPLLSQQ